MLKKHELRRFWYRFRHDYLTMNNVVLGVAIIIAIAWAWGSVSMMQRNYALQNDLDAKLRQKKLTELEVATLRYQQRYYASDEYKELAARENLGLANPGEKVFILPPNTSAAYVLETPKSEQKPTETASNFTQWMNFFFGKNAQLTK